MSQSVSRNAVGSVVAGRYRLVATIGSGPTATVYLADDVRLRRRVAVKLLAGSLAAETSFVTRFRSEMQEAAALRHPHVAVVHDWGIGDDVFVVSEYLENGSLRGLVDRGVRLSLPQALQVALAASRALAFAHERGVIHRDVRPGNICFAVDGRLRIGDFGLARAYAEAASTEPMGMGVVGVRYASPEQAQGRSVDGRSDIYALALVLIEAVTGRVPFATDTALGTLMARIDHPIDVPEELGVLAGPLRRAGADDPTERLDAAGLATALMAVADRLDDPSPIAFGRPVAPTGTVATSDVPRRTRAPDDRERDDITRIVAVGSPDAAKVAVGSGAPVVGADAPDRPVPIAPHSGTDVDKSGEPSVGPAGSADGPMPAPDAATAAVTQGSLDAGAGAAGTTGDADRRRVNRRRWRIAWAVLALVVIVGGGAVGFVVFQAQRTPTHTVPSVSGLTPAAAQARLQRLGFDVATRHVRRDGTRAGQLLGVKPNPGVRLAEGDTATLVVSAGQTLVAVPGDLGGLTPQAARTRLEDVGLEFSGPQQAYSESVPDGQVVSVAPGTPRRLEKGAAVTVVVSEGPKPRVVPSVSGMTPDAAEAALRQIGLIPEVTTRLDTRIDTGGLIGLEPGPGATVARGAKVTVVVSSGLGVVVPSLDGVTTVAEAIAKLQSVGLTANQLHGSGSLSGKPVAFDPGSGQLVPKGSPVNIVVH